MKREIFYGFYLPHCPTDSTKWNQMMDLIQSQLEFY